MLRERERIIKPLRSRLWNSLFTGFFSVVIREVRIKTSHELILVDLFCQFSCVAAAGRGLPIMDIFSLGLSPVTAKQ